MCKLLSSLFLIVLFSFLPKANSSDPCEKALEDAIRYFKKIHPEDYKSSLSFKKHEPLDEKIKKHINPVRVSQSSDLFNKTSPKSSKKQKTLKRAWKWFKKFFSCGGLKSQKKVYPI